MYLAVYKITNELKLTSKGQFASIGKVADFRVEDAIDGVNHAEIIIDEEMKNFENFAAQFKIASKAKQQKLLEAMQAVFES